MTDRRYGFVKPRLIRLFSLVDAAGGLLVRPFRRSVPAAAPRRILLVNLAHIGDVLLTTPAIASVRAAFPTSHLTMLTAPWGRAAVAANPRLDEIAVYRPSWWDRERGSPYLRAGEFRRLVSLARAGRYDLVVNFKSFFQENLAFALAGIPRRAGYGLYGGGFLQTDLVPFPWERHTVLQHLALVEAIGVPGLTPKLELAIPAADEAAAEALLREAGVESADRLVALHVGAGFPSKLWPLDRYVAVANALADRHDATIALVGGTEDLPLVGEVGSQLHSRSVVAAGRLSLAGSAALIRRAALFIGNDSGPAHLAAAVETPAVVIFSGQNEPAIWRPWGDRVTVLQHRPFCAPCGLVACNRDHACMTEISVDRVLAEAGAWLGPR